MTVADPPVQAGSNAAVDRRGVGAEWEHSVSASGANACALAAGRLCRISVACRAVRCNAPRAIR